MKGGGARTAVSISSGGLLDQLLQGRRPPRAAGGANTHPVLPLRPRRAARGKRREPGSNLITPPPPTYVEGTLTVITGRALN